MARYRDEEDLEDDYEDRDPGVDVASLFSAFDWKGAKRSAKVGGRKKLFENPSKLWALACQYFEYTESNPVRKHDFIRSGVMAGKAIYTYHPRPFTWMGFESFLWVRGICSTLEPYRENREGRYEEYVEVIRAIGNVMKSQKFDGAAVGLFKEGLIVRDLYPEKEKGEERDPANGAPQFTAPVVNVYFDGAPPLSNSEAEVDTTRKELTRDGSKPNTEED
jgi:hypothetical protein